MERGVGVGVLRCQALQPCLWSREHGGEGTSLGCGGSGRGIEMSVHECRGQTGNVAAWWHGGTRCGVNAGLQGVGGGRGGAGCVYECRDVVARVWCAWRDVRVCGWVRVSELGGTGNAGMCVRASRGCVFCVSTAKEVLMAIEAHRDASEPH